MARADQMGAMGEGIIFAAQLAATVTINIAALILALRASTWLSRGLLWLALVLNITWFFSAWHLASQYQDHKGHSHDHDGGVKVAEVLFVILFLIIINIRLIVKQKRNRRN